MEQIEADLKPATFTKAFVCSNIVDMEEQVNDWLRTFKDDITEIKDIKIIENNALIIYTTDK